MTTGCVFFFKRRKSLSNFLKVIFHLQLLQNISYILCVVQNGYNFLLLEELLVFFKLPGPFETVMFLLVAYSTC